MFRPHHDRPLAARKGTLPGKLQDVLAPVGWGQKKLELARWSQFDLVGWGPEHLLESARCLFHVAGARSSQRDITAAYACGPASVTRAVPPTAARRWAR